MILEVCVDSFSSLKTALEAGADRIELCSALSLGGLTPGYGLLKMAEKVKDKEIFVMIRPRSGDFFYDDDEFNTMLMDVDIVKNMGYSGIVIGMLLKDGKFDIIRMKNLIRAAYPLRVALHRAFDYAKNPEDDINTLISMGICRILTAGEKPDALEGAPYIKDIQDRYGANIGIMPGGGVNAGNIEEIFAITGCTNYHLSGRKSYMSSMKYKALGSENEYVFEKADFNKIKAARVVLDKIKDKI